MAFTRAEYLLQCLSEEACEIAQAVSKVQRFGPQNVWPGYDGTALERLAGEVLDLLAILEMMDDEPSIGVPLDDDAAQEHIRAKKIKVTKMMEYSRELGMLKDAS